MLISTFFCNSRRKIPKEHAFAQQFKQCSFFFFFFEKFCNLTNLRMLISNMAITFLKFQLKNRQVRYFFSQVKAVLFLEICRLDKFEGADFKYDNNFLKIYPKNIEIRYFLSQIQAFLFFHKMFQLGKFDGVDLNVTLGFF